MHTNIRKTALRLLKILQQESFEAFQNALQQLRDHLQGILDWPGTEKHPPLLFSAVKAGNLQAARHLVQLGASLEVPDHQGRTPLYQAFASRHFDIAHVLIEAGASLEAQNQFGTRVLDVVISSGNLDWLHFFLQRGVPLDHTNHSDLTPLHWAARSGSVEMLHEVLKHTHFTLDAVSFEGHAPLHHATTLEMFQTLMQLKPGLELDVTFRNGTHLLHRVAQQGEVQLMQHLLDLGLNPEVGDTNKSTPLFYAVSGNRPEMVEALIERKARVNARNRYNYRPLHWGAERGFLEVCGVLLRHGAKPNVKLNKTFIIQETHTPLYLAVKEKHLDVARLLIQHGADVNDINDASNATALCAAVRNNDLPMMQLLLDHGAHPRGLSRPKDASFEYYEFPLACACSREAVELLLERGADVNEKNRWQDTALHVLVRHLEQKDLKTERGQGTLQAIALLLEHGANVHLTNWHGRKPLADAQCKEVSALLAEAARNQQEVAPISDQQQAQQAQQDTYFSAVHSMAELWSGKEVEWPGQATTEGLGPELLSLAHSAYTAAELETFEAVLQQATADDVRFVGSAAYDNLETPLHRVIERMYRYGSKDKVPPLSQFQRVIAMLIEKGADLNHQETLYGDTPLHKLVRASATHYPTPQEQERFVEMLDRMLQHGADPAIRNFDGNTALDFAHWPGILQHLLQNGAGFGSHHRALFDSIEYQNLQAFERCLEMRVPLKGTNRNGHTALMHAVVHNRPEMVKGLIEQGADVQRKTTTKDTLLHLACQEGAFETLDFLLEHTSLDVNARNNKGDTAVKFLLEGNWNLGSAQETRNRIVGLVVKMVQKGADLHLKNHAGQTPMESCSTRVLAREVQKGVKGAL